MAALVSLTTMTRMVDEERVLIGTFKALGYSNGRIASKYLVYAMVASGVGSIVGIVLLSQFLPWFIMNAYAIIYVVPCRPTPIDPALFLLAAGLSVGITVAATLFAAMATLREKPAALMLPRAEGRQAHSARTYSSVVESHVVQLEGYCAQPLPL